MKTNDKKRVLNLSKETVRNLAVRSDIRTGVKNGCSHCTDTGYNGGTHQG